MIGIIGAMDEEISRIVAVLDNSSSKQYAGMTFYKGTINNKDVVLVRSGIGKVNAAICAQILSNIYKTDYIINTGIAGSLNAAIDIGDIVLSRDALQHDMDAVAFGYEAGVIPRMETSTFEGSAYLIDIAKNASSVLNDIKIHVGRVVTGDQFISDADVKKRLVSQFHGDCTEMEGAAIAQTAFLNNIPFLIIRAISDKADNSASMDYPEFEAMAISNSVSLLLEMIRLI